MVNMNLDDYTYLLNRPEKVNAQKTEALEKIVTEFPYFQSARALRLKGLYGQNSFQYNYALKVTAAYTTDRSVLFDFITSDSFTAIQKGAYDKKMAELNDMPVVAPIDVATVEEKAEEKVEDKVEASILQSIRESELAKEILVTAETVVAELPAESLVEQPLNADESGVEGVELVSVKPEVESPEDKLEIGRPLEFLASERHSFAEWLMLSSLKPIDRTEETQVEEEAQPLPELESPEWQKKQELIDRFLRENPKIPPVRQDYTPPAPELPREDSSLMTETLARVYLEQKKYQKAIQAYEILILKYPEKSIFFADRISEIKKLQQNNN